MKKKLCFLLTILMALAGFAPRAQAQTVWNGTTDISWYDVSQTSFDISTPEQLAGVAALMTSHATNFSGKTLNLTADIWLNADNDSTNNWVPIGGYATANDEAVNNSSTYAFSGTFKGNGHTIHNLYCDKSSYFQAGLFGCVQYPCTIDSLVLLNPVVKARGMSGSLIGYTLNAGNVYVSNCLVINCRVEATGNNNNGGLLGGNWQMQNGSYWTYITNCGVTGHVAGKYIGGVAGNGQKINTTNVYFAGTLSPVADNGTLKYGGILGHADAGKFNFTNTYSNISSSYSSGRDGTVMTETAMQDTAFVTTLGNAFKMDNGINNGYPIMNYMAGVDPLSAEICQGESVTLTAFGFDSYLWSNNSTADAITVFPTTTTTYTVTCTANGVPTVFSIPVTVYPQAVITATVTASSDGQTHGTVTPASSTIPCGSTADVTLTVTPDDGWRVSSVIMNGTLLYGEQTYGPYTFTVNPGGTLADVVVNLTNTPSCAKVTNLVVANLFGTDVTLSWKPAVSGMPAQQYNVTVRNLYTDTETTDVTYDTFYLASGLDYGASYRAYVTATCTDGYESAPDSLNFNTPSQPIMLPYVEDFEGNEADIMANITLSNNGTNGWNLGTATNNGGSHALYISNDNGASNAYTVNAASNAYAVLNVEFPQTPMEYHLSFDWKADGEGNYDYLYVYLADGGYTLPTSGAPSGTDLCGKLNQHGSWQHVDVILNSNVIGTSKKVIFWWKNDTSVGTQPPAAIDNLSLVGYPCGMPTGLAVDTTTMDGATVSWTENGSSTDWIVYYRAAGATDFSFETASGTPTYTFSGLSGSTLYEWYVVADCGDEISSPSAHSTFHTDCGPITELPYFTNFDNVASIDGTNFIPCWSRLTTNPDRVVRCYGSATHSAPYSLDFNYSPSCTTAAVTPMIDPSIPLNSVMVDFWAISSLGQGWMEVGTMSDPTDFSTYEFYDTVRLSAPSTWENLMINFENYTGTNQYIAFLEINGTSTSYIFDDFTIDYIPVCVHPTNLAVDSLTNTTVTLSWTEVGEASTWEIEYGPAGFTPGSGTTATAYENPFTVDNLTPATTYDFYVYANCSSDMSDPFGPVSATPGQYIMQANGSDTVTTCGLLIYDDGGPNGNYSNNCNTTLVLYPENPGSVLMLTGSVSTESNYDKFYIYDGVGTGGTELLYVSGSNSNVNEISTTGPLTIKFTSDNSVNSYFGYAITAQCISCYPPYGVTASNIMPTAADISWHGSGDSYLVYLYGADTTVIPVTDTTLALTTLDVNSSYTVAVQALCDGNDSSYLSSSITFTTPTIPATLPYAADFEDASDNIQWGILNGTQTNKWYIGEPTDATSDVNTTVGGTNGLYISNNNGASNTYTGTTSRVYAFRDILVPDGVTELKLSFDWKAMGGSAHDEFLRVYWLDPVVVNVTAGNNPPSVGGVNYDLYGMPGYPTLGAHWLSQQNTWQHEEMLISATQFEGMGNGDHIYRLYFHWRNTTSSNNPPAAVDNISLSAVTCATPLNVTVSNIGENTATVSWAGTADQFVVTVISATDTDYQTSPDTSLVLTGLNANTTYQVAVRGFCGTDSSMISQGVQFTTACGAITTVPYTENFDTYSSMGGSNFINCWYRHTSDPANHWVYVNSGADAYSGGSLDFHYTPNCYTMAITPMFDANIQLNTLMIEGMTKIHLNGTAGVFEVGTVSDPNDPTTFTPYDTIEYSETFTWLPFTVLLNNYTGSDHYIAFRATNGISVSYLLDNITIDAIPACWHPVNPMVSNITDDGATISWEGTSANYVVEYGPTGFAEGTGTTVNVPGAMSYTLTGLNETTDYTVYISSDCGADGLSSSVSVNFQTTMLAAAIPYSTDFSDPTDSWILNNGSCANTWVRGTVNGSGALFVTQDGTTPGYNTSSTSQVSAEKLFTVGTDTTVTIQFDLQVGGESTYDYFKLFLAPATQEYPAATSITSSDYGYNSYSQYAYNFYLNNYSSSSTYPCIMNLTGGNTVHIIAEMPNPNSNPDAYSTAKLVFAWKNDFSTGTPPGAIISNLQVGPITCPTPSNLTVSNVTMTTADVSWTAGGTETAWNLEYKESTATTWTTVPVTTNSYQLSNLAAATLYDVRVQADCSGGDNSLYTATSFGTTLCAPSDQCAYTFNLADTYSDSWNNATLEVMQNGIHVATLSMGSGSSSITETVLLCDNLSTSLVWHSGNYDNECSFSVVGPDGSSVYASPSTLSAGTLTTFTTNCSGFTPEPVDPTVATNAAENITSSSAVLHATITNPDDVTITAKGFAWKESQGGTFTQIAGNGTGNSFTADLTGLTASTGYTFKAFITFNGNTVYGSEMTFTTENGDTPEPCATPTNVAIGEVTEESITVTWDANPDVASWNIQYSTEGGALNSATTNENTYTISDLEAGTSCSIQVQANCGDGNLSPWTEPVTATTLHDGIDSWLAGSVTLYPNPAKEYVDIRIDGDLNVTAMEVYDVYGKIVRGEVETRCTTSLQTTRINVSGLANGMYFVRVTTEAGMVTKTFVKR